MKDLRQITVIGLGLLGGSTTLAISRAISGAKTVGYTHRPSTRRKARRLKVATEIVDGMGQSVADADLVILATPARTFEGIFGQIAKFLPDGYIVTDVGSTKVLAHRWAKRKLPKTVHYVGSQPIARSEQRGIEFARDDLFEQANCILTRIEGTNRRALQTLTRFWSALGCSVRLITPAEHDRILANVSHVPHIVAVALMSANSGDELKFASRGSMDTSRIASGPANIWADVLLTNAGNTVKGIDRIITDLTKLRRAIRDQDSKRVENLLATARDKRAALIKHKMRKKELIP